MGRRRRWRPPWGSWSSGVRTTMAADRSSGLGDGVMLYFTEPDRAVVSALELADAVPAAGLPPPHTDIDSGPGIFQDGDYLGRTVNTSARIASHAGPGQILVSDEVVRSIQNPTIRFVDLGPVDLQGLPRPVSLHRASRDT